MDALAGVTESERRIGALTVTLVELVMEPEEALMLEPPSMLPVTNPAALMGATAGALDDHVTEAVMSCMPPSV